MKKLLFVLGAVTGVFFLGNNCSATTTPEKAIELYKQAADAGNPDAMCQLASCYEYGDGVEENPAEALKLYRGAFEHYKAAAGAGDPEAKFKLAGCYRAERVLEKDLVKSVELYKQAADAGHPMAKIMLAWCYHYGEGVEENLQEAVNLYRKADFDWMADRLEAAVASGK